MRESPSEPGPRAALRDLAPLVQAAVFYADGMWGEAVFDLCFDAVPGGAYAVVAGVERGLRALSGFRLDPELVEAVGELPDFARLGPGFLEELRELRFTGSAWSVPEGSVVFPHEPVLRVQAPLIEAILLGQLLQRELGFASAVATRAARSVRAAAGRSVVDASAGRWHGAESLRAAGEAAYVGGVDATVDPLLARELGLELVDFVGGNFAEAYGDVRLAFEAMGLHLPGRAVLLLPEEDPRESLGRFAGLGRRLSWVRVQHPRLAMAARLVREALDERGWRHVRILASGIQGSEQLAELVERGVPIDRFALSTALTEGIPAFLRALSYRLAERPSGGKREPARGPWSSHYPGSKQVIRFGDFDLLCLEHEAELLADGEHPPRLRLRLAGGEPVGPAEPLARARERCRAELDALPGPVHRSRDPRPLPLRVSDGLTALTLG